HRPRGPEWRWVAIHLNLSWGVSLLCPRVPAELQDAAKRFSQGGVSHYLTLTLDEAEGLLYVGAREAVFALATGTISWEAPVEKKAECVQKGKNNQTDCFNYVRFLQSYNSSHLYACGTYAFQPKCDTSGALGGAPHAPHTPLNPSLTDGELYSATFNNFLGTEPVILRNLGPHYSMKTEYLTSWLNEPHFVASAFVPESAGSSTGDDDKVYFFFSERAVEYDCYAEQVVARVARVCKGDVGGARTLQKKWTTFLKARLLCSAPEQQLHFNRLQSVFTLRGPRWQDTAFFGVFQAGDVDVSAICRYHILEVRKAFEGPYKEYREQAQRWGRYSRGAQPPCITDWHRQNGFGSSLELPDNTLNFAKKHPLMDEAVPPQRGRPLLLKRDANFTQLVVDRVAGLDGNVYEVLFIGTGDGWVHKALDLGSRIHLVEELQVFEPAQPVESLVLAATKVQRVGVLLVSLVHSGVTQWWLLSPPRVAFVPLKLVSSVGMQLGGRGGTRRDTSLCPSVVPVPELPIPLPCPLSCPCAMSPAPSLCRVPCPIPVPCPVSPCPCHVPCPIPVLCPLSPSLCYVPCPVPVLCPLSPSLCHVPCPHFSAVFSVPSLCCVPYPIPMPCALCLVPSLCHVPCPHPCVLSPSLCHIPCPIPMPCPLPCQHPRIPSFSHSSSLCPCPVLSPCVPICCALCPHAVPAPASLSLCHALCPRAMPHSSVPVWWQCPLSSIPVLCQCPLS
uniref:Sema domain-containing protein n=1 Tax=Malurus cyaneus samueli TaxID=2593467 RepID=A0A8C5TJF6_9PASS